MLCHAPPKLSIIFQDESDVYCFHVNSPFSLEIRNRERCKHHNKTNLKSDTQDVVWNHIINIYIAPFALLFRLLCSHIVGRKLAIVAFYKPFFVIGTRLTAFPLFEQEHSLTSFFIFKIIWELQARQSREKFPRWNSTSIDIHCAFMQLLSSQRRQNENWVEWKHKL